MKCKLFVVALMAGLSLGTAAPAGKDAPAEARVWSFAIAAEAERRVDAVPGDSLLQDEVFVKLLADVVRSELTPEAKVDAFTLMQERIGWLFAGSVRVFPDRGYVGTFQGMLGTYVRYQNELTGLRSRAPSLTPLIGTCEVDVVRCSSALLLTALLDPELASQQVKQLVRSSAEKSAQAPEVLIHSVALSAVLTRNPATVVELVPLLHRAESEESREDLVCALASTGTEDALRALMEFAELEFALGRAGDTGAQTALFAIKRRLMPEAWAEWRVRLAENLSAANRAIFDQAEADGFRSAAEGSPLKLWDGWSAVVYNDGIHMSHPSGLSYFRAGEE